MPEPIFMKLGISWPMSPLQRGISKIQTTNLCGAVRVTQQSSYLGNGTIISTPIGSTQLNK
jgi:hypothetical protein